MIDFFLKGGFLMYPILLCSLAGIALLINKYLQYNKTLKDISGPIKDSVNSKPAILLPLLKAIENGSNEKELSVVGTRKVREIEKGLNRLGLNCNYCTSVRSDRDGNRHDKGIYGHS